MMEIKTSEMKRVVLIEVSGRVGIEQPENTATILGFALDQYADKGMINLVVDFSKVECMGSSGLRELVRILKRVKRTGGDLRIANPSDKVREVMELAGLDTIFEVYPTQIEAIGSF